MTWKIVKVGCLFVLFCLYGNSVAQSGSGDCDFYRSQMPSPEQLEDLAESAENQVRDFFETIRELGVNEKPEETKLKYIRNNIQHFTPDGTVEERSKYATKGRVRGVKEYLHAIKARGEVKRVLISYVITDPLLPNTLKCKMIDGQLYIYGTITVEQHYCRIKYDYKLSDNFNFDEHCDYWDVTYKEVNIEMKLMKSVFGVAWVTLIKSITVLKVE